MIVENRKISIEWTFIFIEKCKKILGKTEFLTWCLTIIVEWWLRNNLMLIVENGVFISDVMIINTLIFWFFIVKVKNALIIRCWNDEEKKSSHQVKMFDNQHLHIAKFVFEELFKTAFDKKRDFCWTEVFCRSIFCLFAYRRQSYRRAGLKTNKRQMSRDETNDRINSISFTRSIGPKILISLFDVDLRLTCVCYTKMSNDHPFLCTYRWHSSMYNVHQTLLRETKKLKFNFQMKSNDLTAILFCLF